jgi:hypothetical protein
MRSIWITIVGGLLMLTVCGQEIVPSAPSPQPQAALPSAPAPTATPIPAPEPTVAPSPTQNPAALTTPAAGPAWEPQKFGVWALEVPPGWQAEAAGAHEGALGLSGTFEGRSYRVSFGYPIFESYPASLEALVEQALGGAQPGGPVEDLSVAGAPAKLALGVARPDGLAHEAYIWRAGDMNPRLISIRSADAEPPDITAMEQLFRRLLSSIEE